MSHLHDLGATCQHVPHRYAMVDAAACVGPADLHASVCVFPGGMHVASYKNIADVCVCATVIITEMLMCCCLPLLSAACVLCRGLPIPWMLLAFLVFWLVNLYVFPPKPKEADGQQ